MKSVLISIRPKWVELIASGKKTVEVRKTRPKLETPFKCYIYCTLAGSNELWRETLNRDLARWNREKWGFKKGNVIGEYICDRIEIIECSSDAYRKYSDLSCLTQDDFISYCNGKDLYGWHISDLKIYDKPKKLSEFRYYYPSVVFENGYPMPTHEIKRPPQNWCYVELVE